MILDQTQIQWLLDSDEPWTRYRTLVDLMDLPEENNLVKEARAGLLGHPKIKEMISETANWPGKAFQRHNDAAYIIYKFSTLADFGIRCTDPGMASGIETIMKNQSVQGAFLSLINITPAFGGSGKDEWLWMNCDAPTLLYILLAMGKEDEKTSLALTHLASLAENNGWRCTAAQEAGRFRGPGRKDDPCPIVNVYALKALSLAPQYQNSSAAANGIEMLLSHWENRTQQKMYLFGIGSDFNKLKYPFIWYNLLHVLDVLSRFPQVHQDRRFLDMYTTLLSYANESGFFTASSIYQSWKGWSFSDKKNPSPWLTFLVYRIQKRLCR